MVAGVTFSPHLSVFQWNFLYIQIQTCPDVTSCYWHVLPNKTMWLFKFSHLFQSLHLKVFLCSLASTDSPMSKPTPLYGQPSWWGEDDDLAHKKQDSSGKSPGQ